MFTQTFIDAANFRGKLPFCAVFGKHLLLSFSGKTKIDLNTPARIGWMLNASWATSEVKAYLNCLFQYLQKLSETGLIDTDTNYIFQMGAADELDS